MIIAIVLIALASLVLGMGLPVTAAYIVLGTLSAPALHGLIADGMLVDALANGQVSETARAILCLPHQKTGGNRESDESVCRTSDY